MKIRKASASNEISIDSNILFLADENKLKAAQEISENFEVSTQCFKVSSKPVCGVHTCWWQIVTLFWNNYWNLPINKL